MAKLKSTVHILKDQAQLLIRSATPEDAVSLLACCRSYIQDGTGQVMTLDEFQHTPESLSRFIQAVTERNNELLLVAESGGQIVGDLEIQTEKLLTFSHAGDLEMGIVPNWRRRGVGGGLLAVALRWAKYESPLEKISLRVLASNSAAIALYKKFEFDEVGRLCRQVKWGLAPETSKYDDSILMSNFLK